MLVYKYSTKNVATKHLGRQGLFDDAGYDFDEPEENLDEFYKGYDTALDDFYYKIESKLLSVHPDKLYETYTVEQILEICKCVLDEMK